MFFNLGELREVTIRTAIAVSSEVRQAVEEVFDTAVFGAEAATKLAKSSGGVLADLGGAMYAVLPAQTPALPAQTPALPL